VNAAKHIKAVGLYIDLMGEVIIVGNLPTARRRADLYIVQL
jgi:hypothetical protein